MSGLDGVARRRLQAAILRKRLDAITDQLNAELAELPPGSRMAGWMGSVKLGSVTIPETKPTAQVTDPEKFARWVRDNWPGQTADVIRPEYARDQRLVRLAREHMPDAVERTVSPVFRDEVTQSVLLYGGFHDDNGEVQPVPGVERFPGGEAKTPAAVLDKDIRLAAENPRSPLPGPLAEALGRLVLELPPAEGGSP